MTVWLLGVQVGNVPLSRLVGNEDKRMQLIKRAVSPIPEETEIRPRLCMA